MLYYLIQSYSIEVDEKYKKHLYPSYLTSYDMKLGGKNFGLQSGLHDALKFTSIEDANLFMNKGIEIFGKSHEFEIVPIDARTLGRAEPKYVLKG